MIGDVKVRGADPTGERQKIYDYLTAMAGSRELERGGHGLTNIVQQMNFVETHAMPQILDKYPAIVEKALGRKVTRKLSVVIQDMGNDEVHNIQIVDRNGKLLKDGFVSLRDAAEYADKQGWLHKWGHIASMNTDGYDSSDLNNELANEINFQIQKTSKEVSALSTKVLRGGNERLYERLEELSAGFFERLRASRFSPGSPLPMKNVSEKDARWLLNEAKRIRKESAKMVRDSSIRKEASELVRIAKELISAMPGENSLDGMNNAKARKEVNKVLQANYPKGHLKDEDWRHVNVIWKALDAASFDWHLVDNFYDKDRDGNLERKTWKFEVDFTNDKGRPTKIYGVVVASFCGTMADPTSEYDIVTYAN